MDRSPSGRRGGLRLVVVLLAIAGIVALFYRSEIDPAELEARYASPESRFLEVDGVRVHYRDEGAGPPLLLIHGIVASLHTWDGWVDELRADFRLIRPDVPGFGLTGPDPTDDYSGRRRVAVLAGLLERLGVERCSVAGNSLGGKLALELALGHPSTVDRLILVDPAGYPRKRKRVFSVFDLGRIPILKNVLGRMTPRFLVAAGVRAAYADRSKVTPELIDRYYELLRRRGNRDALVIGLNSGVGLDRLAIRAMPQPTLILWGREDQLISAELADDFRADIQNSKLIVYDEVGHVPMEEIPERSARDAREFLLRPSSGYVPVR